MKRRYQLVLNLFSLSFLLFALYLNLLKKDNHDVAVLSINQSSVLPASASLKNAWHGTRPYKPSDGTMVLK